MSWGEDMARFSVNVGASYEQVEQFEAQEAIPPSWNVGGADDVPSQGNFPLSGKRDLASKDLPDPIAVRRNLKHLCRSYVRANFHSPKAVEKAFRCSQSQAYKLWNGEVEPGGWFIIMALRLTPQQAVNMLVRAA